ncbi:hypothetical protein HK101_004849, partial [Irineochytrium annulatum]
MTSIFPPLKSFKQVPKPLTTILCQVAIMLQALTPGPNTSTSANDFFQSDRDLEASLARNAKQLQYAEKGAPIRLPSKVLAILFPSSQLHGNTVFVGESGHVARRVDFATGKGDLAFKGHAGPVTCLALAGRDQERLYTGSWDKTLRGWDARSGDCVVVMKAHADFVKCVLVLPAGLFPGSGGVGGEERILSGSSDATIRCWEGGSGDGAGKLLGTWKGHGRAVESLVLGAEDGGDDGTDRTGGNWVVYSGSSDTKIGRWDPVTGELKSMLEGHLTSVYGLWLEEGDLWSVSADKTARRWDLKSWLPDTTLEHPDFVKCAVVVGGVVVTGSRDENIRTGKLVKVIEAHFGEVSCMAQHDGKLWTGSLDGTVRRWELSELMQPDPDPAEELQVLGTEALAPDAKGDAFKMSAEEEAELAELMGDDAKGEISWLAEAAGSLGDMGTLLPLLVSLSNNGQISITASLVFGGLFNISLGFFFREPLCVQPMKAIAAVAIASHLTLPQVMAAGLCVSSLVMILSLTRTLSIANRLIPLPLMRGIQLGTGIQLIVNGCNQILAGNYWRWEGMQWSNNLVIAFAAFVLAMLCFKMRRNPTAIVLFVYGVVIALVRVYATDHVTVPGIGPSFIAPFVPSGADFRVAFINAALGQLPLTILNSVVATSNLAQDLFPGAQRGPVAPTITGVGVFVGMMNLISAWFGCIPYCSGSGGLAAQHRFGARTGWSVVMLGVFKIAMGLIFGAALPPILAKFPTVILGIMLVMAGVELASVAKDVGGTDPGAQNRFVVTLITGCVVAGFANDGVGFIAGS